MKCGKKFSWTIERPGDGYWDRWRSDDGNTAASWFLSKNFCWEHAFQEMPERFRSLIRTLAYDEESADAGSQSTSPISKETEPT